MPSLTSVPCGSLSFKPDHIARRKTVGVEHTLGVGIALGQGRQVVNLFNHEIAAGTDAERVSVVDELRP